MTKREQAKARLNNTLSSMVGLSESSWGGRERVNKIIDLIMDGVKEELREELKKEIWDWPIPGRC